MPLPEESARSSDVTAIPTATDDELVALARSGSATAYGELWRRHSGIGISIARRYYEIADADDIVSESFARILATLHRGGGPHSGFRPYLITTIGNVARRWATRSREGASDELDFLEDPKTVDDPVVASTDREFALQAFRALPDRWQAVLWYSAVEGMGPTEVARYLGMTPNAAAVLAHRARAGLRTAWIQAHLNDESLSDECRWTSGRLGRRATSSLGPREHDRVRAHLNSCAACRARAEELDHLSAKLAVLLIPALLGISLIDLEPDDSAVALAALPEPPLATLSATHVWLTGIAVAIVTATALLTSATDPTLGTVEMGPATVPAAFDLATDDVLPTLAGASEQTSGTVQSPATAAEPDPVAPESPPAPLGPREMPPGAVPPGAVPPSAVPPSAVPPLAPAVASSVDPDSLRPPSLSGSGLPGAEVLITDELGNEIASTRADSTGAWATGELSVLSAAASTLLVRQIDGSGLVSPATAVGPLAARPRISGPADGYSTFGDLPFDITVQAWPGSTIHATFEALEHYGYTEPTTYPDTQIVVDAEGNGILHIDGSVLWHHHMTLWYIDDGRASASTVGMTFSSGYWPD